MLQTMSNTGTVEIPASDTAEGKLWREILTHDNTTAAAIPAGDNRMLMGGSALSPPELAKKVAQADADEGADRRVGRMATNTHVGKIAVYSLIRTTAKGRAVCADDLREKMDTYRHLAVDEHELARWVLYNLMVYVLALWGSHSNDEIRDDIDLVHKTLAGIRADINTT